MTKITSMDQLKSELLEIRKQREGSFWPQTGPEWTGEVYFRQGTLLLKSTTLPRIADVSANRQNGKMEMALEVEQASRAGVSFPITDISLRSNPLEIVSYEEAQKFLQETGLTFYRAKFVDFAKAVTVQN